MEDTLILSHCGEAQAVKNAAANPSRLFRTVVIASLFLGVMAAGTSVAVILQDPYPLWQRLVVEQVGIAVPASVWIISSAWSKVEFVCAHNGAKSSPAAAIAFFSFYFTLFSIPIEKHLVTPDFQLATVPGMILIVSWVALWHLLDLRITRSVP